jgi:transposase
MLADELDYVIGVDTHRDEHVLAVITAPAGAVVAGEAVRTDARGYRTALRLAARYAPGRRAWAIEGTGSYGAGLARYLAERGETVLEVGRTPRAERRLRGKDDALDAARTARAVLASETLALPRAGERREALRLLLVARRSAVDVRREGLAQPRGVIITAPDRLRAELRGLPTGKLLDRCSRMRRSSAADADELATRLVLRSLARRIAAANSRSRPARTRTARTRARARTQAARRARRRPDRRRATDRRLVTGTGTASHRGRTRCVSACRTSTWQTKHRS